MGLFDKIKTKVQEKANEVHVCHHCGKEFSGLFNGMKASDGQYFCAECAPRETKLMRQKDVCGDFRFYKLDSNGLEKYIAYREKEKERIDAFRISSFWLGDKFLVDSEHQLFKLKEYEEVFHIQQIERVVVAAGYQDDKITVVCGFLMKNPIYKYLSVTHVMKCKSLLRKNKYQEYYDYMEEFHESVCPNAEFALSRF